MKSRATGGTAAIVMKAVLGIVLFSTIAVASVFVWNSSKTPGPGEGFVSGNGRIEATEIDVATKLAGRVKAVFVNEGDFVPADQPLALMQIDTLEAQRDEAQAQYQRALSSVASAKAQVAARKSDRASALTVVMQRKSDTAAAQAVVLQRKSDSAAAHAVVVQRESELDAAKRRFDRDEPLSKTGAVGLQTVDDDRARVNGAAAALNASKAQVTASEAMIETAKAQVAAAEATVEAAKAQVTAAEAAIEAAEAEVVGAGFSVTAAKATIARIEADIQDSTLTSPRDCRVQFRVAQPGEVLAAGGKVLNLVDLGDVYMTFFLPETVVGKVALGSEVHLVLDAARQYVIPAKVSYVSSTAQFTPKTVETQSERQKLMFRVKAQIDRDLLQKHLKLVKTGLPGMAWLKLDPQAKWPANLQVKVPE